MKPIKAILVLAVVVVLFGATAGYKHPFSRQRGVGGSDGLVFDAPLTSSLVDNKGAAATFTRASTATQSIIDATCTTTTLSTVASGSPRFDCACDSSDTRICGIRAEPLAINTVLHSDGLDNVAWTPAAGVTVTANHAVAPDGTTTADQIEATAGGLLQTVTVTASAQYTASFLLKAAAPVTVPVIVDGTSTNCNVLTTWTTCSSTDASSSSTSIILGLGVGTYVVDAWSAQNELGSIRTSRIATTTAAVQRNADALSYPFVVPQVGTMRMQVLCPNLSAYIGSTAGLVTLSAGATTDFIETNITAIVITNDSSIKIKYNNATQSSLSSGYKATDGTINTIHSQWSANNNACYQDFVTSQNPDTSATIPAATTLYLGDYRGTIGSGHGCLVSGVRVYKKQVLK